MSNTGWCGFERQRHKFRVVVAPTSVLVSNFFLCLSNRTARCYRLSERKKLVAKKKVRAALLLIVAVAERIELERIGDRTILFIAGAEDTRMPPAIAQTLYAASPSTHKNIVIIPKAAHGAAFRTDPETCAKAIMDCLQKVAELNQPTLAKDATP